MQFYVAAGALAAISAAYLLHQFWSGLRAGDRGEDAAPADAPQPEAARKAA